MTWMLLLLIILMIAVQSWASVRRSHQGTNQLQMYLQHIRTLEDQVERMADAMARQGGAQVLPRPVEPRPTDGWLDGKPRLKPTDI